MFDIILSSLAYVKGGSLNQDHSKGLEGVLGEASGGKNNEPVFYNNLNLPTNGATQV